METDDAFVLLTRLDPDRNMARFYVLSIEPTLFGDFAVHRNWGRLGTSGRSRLDLFANASAANAHKERLTALKLKRGYHVT